MRLDRYTRAADFLAAAGDYLADHEAEHNLILGIAGTLLSDQDSSDDPPYFAVVAREQELVAAALRTPPWNLVLSEVDDPAALELLVNDLAGEELPGVTGPPAAAEQLAALWTARRGGSAEQLMEERIYRLTRVIPPAPAGGRPRRATSEDRGLLLDWVVAFHEEALPAEGGDRARREIEAWDPQTGRQFWLWEDDGQPVSLVGAGSPTPSGIRIGPVYTPPEHRGHGYASTLTAFVSQRMLDEGRRFCFLYTNLANPTANHIYHAIGYEPVTDALMIRFAPSAGA